MTLNPSPQASFNDISSEITYLFGQAWTNPDQAIDGGLRATGGFLADEDSMRALVLRSYSNFPIFSKEDEILGLNLLLDITNGDGPLHLRVRAWITSDAGATQLTAPYTNLYFPYEDGSDPRFIHPSPIGFKWGLSSNTLKGLLSNPNFGFIVQITQIDGMTVSSTSFGVATLYVYLNSGPKTFHFRGGLGSRERILWGVR